MGGIMAPGIPGIGIPGTPHIGGAGGMQGIGGMAQGITIPAGGSGGDEWSPSPASSHSSHGSRLSNG